jgi:hypothetical protein
MKTHKPAIIVLKREWIPMQVFANMVFSTYHDHA